MKVSDSRQDISIRGGPQTPQGKDTSRKNSRKHGLAAKNLYGCGDFFLIPSQYEPCGLTDLFAQMMGNVPVVHAVGGLVKVLPGKTGYSYKGHSVEALVEAIEQTISDYTKNPQRLETLRRQAFAEVFEHYTWEKVLREGYLPLYRA